MGISIGKLVLYVAAGGLTPARVLPVCIDVGAQPKRWHVGAVDSVDHLFGCAPARVLPVCIDVGAPLHFKHTPADPPFPTPLRLKSGALPPRAPQIQHASLGVLHEPQKLTLSCG